MITVLIIILLIELALLVYLVRNKKTLKETAEFWKKHYFVEKLKRSE